MKSVTAVVDKSDWPANIFPFGNIADILALKSIIIPARELLLDSW